MTKAVFQNAHRHDNSETMIHLKYLPVTGARHAPYGLTSVECFSRIHEFMKKGKQVSPFHYYLNIHIQNTPLFHHIFDPIYLPNRYFIIPIHV